MAVPPSRVRRLRRLAPLLPLAGLGPVKRFLSRRIDRLAPGPSEEVRATARVEVWGEARDASGRSVSATLETPEAYHFTALSAVAAAERAAAGAVPLGAHTPSGAFGADFALSIPGVVAGELKA
jgi:short subunit dehydrogenase-like uncharacterized protein